MIPVARTKKLFIQEVGGELIIYDRKNNTSHCLNQMAARVWELCDGCNTVRDLACLLEEELQAAENSDVDMRGLVWLTLEELERYNLIKEYRKKPVAVVPNISRRKVIKAATLVGGVTIGSMFPLVRSIVVPKPAIAASGEEIIASGFCDLEVNAVFSKLSKCVSREENPCTGVCKKVFSEIEPTVPVGCKCVKH